MNHSKRADVAVWGRIPPPIGGMAVHLKRLLPHLEQAGITVQMYSVGRRTPEHPGVRQVSDHRIVWFLSLLFGACEPVHYVFSDSTSARFAASLLSLVRGAKVILRMGSRSLEMAAGSANLLERSMIRFATRRATAVVGVSRQICDLAAALGAERVLQIPGFIPEADPIGALPDEVRRFLVAGEGPTILASGEIQDPGGEDLYGAYALLDLLESLPNFRIVFYAYRITLGADSQDRLQEEIRRRGHQRRYLLFRSTTDLLPAMLSCELMVRPTLSDGDSNAVREALHLGLPVIASDCVERPEGVITYPAGDPVALQRAILAALADLDRLRERVRSLPRPDYAKPIVALLGELLGRAGKVEVDDL